MYGSGERASTGSISGPFGDPFVLNDNVHELESSTRILASRSTSSSPETEIQKMEQDLFCGESEQE